jgi:guanylate kinase
MTTLDRARILASELPEGAEAWATALQIVARANAIRPRDVPRMLESQSAERLSRDLRSGDRLVVGVCGPGAVGKDTVLQSLKARCAELSVAVLHTTRRSRAGEVDGVDFHFVEEPAFDALEAAGALLYSRRRPGRGRYGLALADPALRHEETIPLVREAPDVVLAVAERLRGGRRGVQAIIFYLVPPDPVFETLCARAIGRSSGDVNAGLAELSQTLRPYNAVHFLSTVELYESGGKVVFLVNDDVDRVSEIILIHTRAALPRKQGPHVSGLNPGRELNG